MLESMSPVSHSWVKTGLAILGASTLALGAALLGAPGAHAATTYITEDDVAPYEDGNEGTDGYNYDQWHVGTTYNPDASVADAFIFGECSVVATNPGNDWSPWPQLLKGYPIDERPTDEAEIREIIEGASLDVIAGHATLQFPIFVHVVDENGQPAVVTDPENSSRTATSPFFTTLRTNPAADGTIQYDNDNFDLIGTGWVLGGNGYLDEFFATTYDHKLFDGYTVDRIELLGVGFNASAADETEVSSISFGGDTYQFGNDCATEEEVTDPEEEEVVAPTPPEKVDTAFGSDALAITLMISGVAIAAAALSIRRSQTE